VNDPTATVTVTRTSTDDIGLREIFVSLDGKDLAILQHGQSVRREILPGPHRIRAHNTLIWKTVEFDVKPGEEVWFTAINRAGWGTYSVLALIGAGPVYLTFERKEKTTDEGRVPPTV